MLSLTVGNPPKMICLLFSSIQAMLVLYLTYYSRDLGDDSCILSAYEK